MTYLSFYDLLPSLQSGFRPGHFTETAVLRVLSDILLAADRGDVSAFVLLDMTAPFDTVKQSILLQLLQSTFGICNTAHRWFPSYLSSRKQHVWRGSGRSSTTYLVCGVSQGSALIPILISTFTLMQTCRCGCTSNERCRGASLLSVNCARSAERFRQPHFRCL